MRAQNGSQVIHRFNGLNFHTAICVGALLAIKSQAMYGLGQQGSAEMEINMEKQEGSRE